MNERITQLPLLPNDGRSPYGNGKELRNFLRTDREAVDYAKMIPEASRVLALGEIHTRDAHKREVIDHLEEFRDLGFTHFALETFETGMQKFLNAYQRSGRYKEDIERYLEQGYGQWSTNAGDLCLQVVDEANRVGMKVVAIDRPRSSHSVFAEQHKRDKWMAKTVKAILERDADHKVVTFSGQAHAVKFPRTMAGLLLSEGVDLVSVQFTGGSIHEKTVFDNSVRNIGAANEKFMAACLSRFPNREVTPGTDWYVHFPQTEDETDFELTTRIVLEMFDQWRE